MKALTSLLVLGISINLNAQTVLQTSVSLPRSGDKLVQQQISFCSPGEVGENMIWDFSDREFLPYTEQIVYMGRLDSVLCMNRNKTSYKYKLSGDSLLCLGHENYTSQITYATPVAWLRYPFSYRDTVSSCFVGEGSYSHTLSLTTYGHISVSADAYGTLLLPGGDTLRNVLRTHRSELIGQHLCSPKDKVEVNLLCTRKALDDRLNHDSISWRVDTYQWYIPGYRYPVLESIETCFLRAGHSSRHFSRSMFYSPEEQKYLEEDPDNMVIRDNPLLLYSAPHLAAQSPGESGQSDKRLTNEIHLSCTSKATTGIQVLNYRLDRDANVEVLMVTVSGMVVYHEPVHVARPGSYAVDIDLSQYHDTDFVLSVIVDGKSTSLKILK